MLEPSYLYYAFISAGLTIVTFMIGRYALFLVSKHAQLDNLSFVNAPMIGFILLSMQLWVYLSLNIAPSPLTLFAPWIFLLVFKSSFFLSLFRDFKKIFKYINLKKILFGLSFITLATISFIAHIGLPYMSWDGISMWGYKSNLIINSREVEPNNAIEETLMLQKSAPEVADTLSTLNLNYTYRHPDYPPLVPLIGALNSFVAGGVDFVLYKIFSFIVLITASLSVFLFLKKRISYLFAATGSLFVFISPLFTPYTLSSQYLGMADFPLAGLVILTSIFSIEYIKSPTHTLLLVLLSLLTMLSLIKNEGIALALLFILMIFLINRKKWQFHLIFLATLIPLFYWKIFTFLQGYHTEFFTREALLLASKAFPERLNTVFDQIIVTLLLNPYIIPILLFIPVVIILGLIQRNSTPIVLMLVCIGYLFISLSIYITSPYQLQWHISLSLDRIATHISGLVLLSLFLLTRVNPHKPGKMLG